MSNAIAKKATSREKSLNTPIALTITNIDFGKYLHEIDPYFQFKEAWLWLTLVESSAIVAPVNIDMIDSNGVVVTKTLILRQGQTIVCQGIRINVATTDPAAVLTVGTGL